MSTPYRYIDETEIQRIHEAGHKASPAQVQALCREVDNLIGILKATPGSTGSPAAGLDLVTFGDPIGLEVDENLEDDRISRLIGDFEDERSISYDDIGKVLYALRFCRKQRAALSAPSPAPAPWADPAFTPMQASANMTLGWTDAQWQEFFALIPEDKYRAVWGAKVRGAAPSTVPALPLLRRRSP